MKTVFSRSVLKLKSIQRSEQTGTSQKILAPPAALEELPQPAMDLKGERTQNKPPTVTRAVPEWFASDPTKTELPRPPGELFLLPVAKRPLALSPTQIAELYREGKSQAFFQHVVAPERQSTIAYLKGLIAAPGVDTDTKTSAAQLLTESEGSAWGWRSTLNGI